MVTGSQLPVPFAWLVVARRTGLYFNGTANRRGRTVELQDQWDQIRTVFEAGIASSKHCAIASTDSTGRPHVTPIGFLFLRPDCSAYYFEEYAAGLAGNLQHNPRVCLMTVQSRDGFWLQALTRARFPSYPGMRLFGTAGELRPATQQELAQLRERIGWLRILPGSRQIWSGLTRVRDIQIHEARPVVYPRMMDHLLG